MNTQEDKDYLIGFLASILLHIVFAGFFILLFLWNDGHKPPKVERKTLNLSQFKSQADEPPHQEAKQSTPTPPQKATPLKKMAKKEPKTPLPKDEAKQKTAQNTLPKEQNATARQAPQKPSGGTLLSELNSEFKTIKKEVGGPIKKLYGEEFERLGKEEQKFIKDNLGSIGRITEKYLRYPDMAGRLGQQGTSVVEFYLYPNGDISDLRLLEGSGYRMLDKNSIETIEIAYKDYPRPTVKTKIRMYVGYSIY